MNRVTFREIERIVCKLKIIISRRRFVSIVVYDIHDSAELIDEFIR